MLFPNSHGYQTTEKTLHSPVSDPQNPRPDRLAAAGKVHGTCLPSESQLASLSGPNQARGPVAQ